MAEVKKATTKVIEKEAPVKAEAVKKTDKEITVKAAAPAVKKAVEKKPAVKKAPTVKKAPAAKKEPAKKTAVKETVNFQFAGKSYTSEELINICKDVWKYDLNGKDADLKSIELYVKPEENTAYYVINGDVTGSFFI